MLKKIATYSFIILGIGILYISTSREMMKRISDKRNTHDEWWGVHHPVEGDLVGISYLYNEKQFHRYEKFSFYKRPCKNTGNINLVVWGDSYTNFIPDSAFTCLVSYQYGRRYFQRLKYKIDTGKKNILLIEIAERYVREYFSSDNMLDYVQKIAIKEDASAIDIENAANPGLGILDKIFNPNISRNIEYNLFNYNFIAGPRKLKASFNYHFFSRASGDVVLSDDKQYMLLKETVNPFDRKSSYSMIMHKELENIVGRLNHICAHYRKEGFDEVYLSIIPNPATILQPVGYNGLIPALQNDMTLQMKCIDIYTVFKQYPIDIYWKGDTHWNNKGANKWVAEVNKMLERESL